VTSAVRMRMAGVPSCCNRCSAAKSGLKARPTRVVRLWHVRVLETQTSPRLETRVPPHLKKVRRRRQRQFELRAGAPLMHAPELG
jgi:hypothetical protein